MIRRTIYKEALIFGLVFRLKKSKMNQDGVIYKVKTEFDINVQLKLNGGRSTKTGPS